MTFESKLLEAMCDALPTQDHVKISAFCRQLIDIAGRENEARVEAQHQVDIINKIYEAVLRQQQALHARIEQLWEALVDVREKSRNDIEEITLTHEALTKFFREVSPNGDDNEI